MSRIFYQIRIAVTVFVMILTAGFIQAQKNQRMVVSHYMVGMPMYGRASSVTVADLKKDIIDAHNLGVEAFQINIGNWSQSNSRDVTAKLYQAASECDFPFFLFPSADYNGDTGTRWLFEEIYDYLRLYANHPNHLKVDGRPLFTSWLGQLKEVDFWRTVKERLRKEYGIDIFYMPYHNIGRGTTPQQIEEYLDKWKGVIDGYFFWGGSTPPFRAGTDPSVTEKASIPESSENMSAALKRRGLPFMTPVVPAFWATCKEPCKYTDHRGAEGMESQWMSIINNQTARWVDLVTWNDMGEDSHWSPHPNPNHSANQGPVWCHAGYAELNKYYIQWWKSGQQPTIEKDKLFYFYRNQFQDATPLKESCPQVCPRQIPDKVYITTMLVSPAKLTIYSGSKTTVHNVAAGIHYLEGDLGEGQQHFTIVRDGKTIIDVTSSEAVKKTPEYKSWSLFSGFAERKP
jgi:glucan endo-1,3-alpha-glucosidase